MKKTFLLAAAVAVFPGLASAGFEIEDATTEENAVSFEISNSIFYGDVDSGETVSEHEIGISWGVLNPWTTELSFEITTEKGGSADLEGIEWSNTFGLVGGETGVGSGDLAVALYTSFSFASDADEDVTLTVGPAFEYDAGPVEMGLNGFVKLPINGGDDPAFQYAVGVSNEIVSGISIGIEAHGEIPNAFNNAGGFDSQEHFIGPVVEIESEDSAAEIRLGVFAGLTDQTPTVAVSADVGFGF